MSDVEFGLVAAPAHYQMNSAINENEIRGPALEASLSHPTELFVGSTPKMSDGSEKEQSMMNQLKTACLCELTFRQTLTLFALLLVSVAGVFRLMLQFSPALPGFVPELLGAALLTVIGKALLRRTNARPANKSNLAEQPVAEQIIEHVTEGILTINQRGQLVSLNPAAERLFGYHARDILNQPVTKLLMEPPSENQKLFHETISMGTVLGLAAGAREMIGQRKNGERFPVEVMLSSMTLGDEQVTVAFARDVSKRKQAQRYLTAHYAATCILAEANSLDEALPKILQTISESLRWDACAYWSLNPSTNELCCSEFYQAPGVTTHPELDTTSLICKQGQGLPGQVCATGKPVWIEDLLRMEDSPCLALAAPRQLRTAFAFPIMLGEVVCGVVEVFLARSQKREPWLLDIMGEFGKQMGHFIARKLDGAMLQRSEERFRQLAENIHEVFWMVDAHDDRIIYVSPSCEGVWGKDLTAMSQSSVNFDVNRESLSFLDLVYSEDRPALLDSIARQKRGEKTSEEYRIVRPDGAIRWVWSRAFPVLDEAKKVYRIVGITADITERRLADEERGRLLVAVEHQRSELQMILDSVPALIFHKDRECRLVRVNAAHAQCFGLPKEQIEGKTDAELGSPYASRYMQDDFSVMTTGESLCGLIEQFHTPTGERWLQTDKVPHRDADGRIIGLVGFAVDITEQKRLEERLRQAQKMEAVGQLAGGVAHDFNNLLTVIIGYSEILLGQTNTDDQNYELLEQIQKAGERAASLTRQLLAFGRKQKLQVKVLNVNDIFQDMTKMLRRMIGEDIELVLHADSQLGQVQADPSQIEQILMNLASNARDAMPKGGTLTFTTANIELEQILSLSDADIAPGSYVLLTVADTGNGMDEATRMHAFEPFFTTKDVGKGTGLGLSTVFGIVKQSNGHIELESQVGHGTTFRIYLPRLATESVRSQESQSPAMNRRGKETVLLVEDEEIVRRLTSFVLQASGYTILSASSGEEALELCREHPGEISLMVTDILMPQMDGVRLAKLALEVRKDLKVLFISGYTKNILENYGDVDSSAAFLSKPVSPQVLTNKVREVLDAHPCKVAC